MDYNKIINDLRFIANELIAYYRIEQYHEDDLIQEGLIYVDLNKKLYQKDKNKSIVAFLKRGIKDRMKNYIYKELKHKEKINKVIQKGLPS